MVRRIWQKKPQGHSTERTVNFRHSPSPTQDHYHFNKEQIAPREACEKMLTKHLIYYLKSGTRQQKIGYIEIGCERRVSGGHFSWQAVVWLKFKPDSAVPNHQKTTWLFEQEMITFCGMDSLGNLSIRDSTDSLSMFLQHSWLISDNRPAYYATLSSWILYKESNFKDWLAGENKHSTLDKSSGCINKADFFQKNLR